MAVSNLDILELARWFKFGSGGWTDLRVNPLTLPELGANPSVRKIIANDGSATTGSAFEFNGSTSNGTIAYYSALDVSSMSIAIWINPDDVSQEELMDRNTAGGFEFYISNGRLIFSPNGSVSAQTSRNTLIAGETQLAVVTVVLEGTSVRVKLYVNGTLQEETVLGATLSTSTDGLIVGQYKSGG